MQLLLVCIAEQRSEKQQSQGDFRSSRAMTLRQI